MKRTILPGAVLAVSLGVMAPQVSVAEPRMDREDIGVAVAAIIAIGVGLAIAKHGKEWNSHWDEDAFGQPFSPSPNVVCLPRLRQCFERSRYSARWQRRIFGG